MSEVAKKYKNEFNPILFANERSEALDEAYKLFIEAFNEYAEKNALSKELIDSLKEQILSTYLEKRASYLFEDRLIDFSVYLGKAISFALTKSSTEEEKDNYTKLFYYKNKHHLVSQE